MNSVDELVSAEEPPRPPPDPTFRELLQDALRDSWPFLGWLAYVPWLYKLWFTARTPAEDPWTSALLWGIPLFLWWAADMYVQRLSWSRILLCAALTAAGISLIAFYGPAASRAAYLAILAWAVYWTRMGEIIVTAESKA
jgi:hypothetical protein